MNYPNLPGGYPTRRPARRSNFFFLFILGFMAFFLFMQYKKAVGRSNAYRDQAEIKIPSEISLDFPEPKTPQATDAQEPLKTPWEANGPVGRSSNSDWEVDTDVQTNEATSLVVGSDKGGPEDSVTNGDWSLEVAESTPAADATPAFGSENAAPPQTKSTTEGDWGLSEVDTEPAIK